MNLTLATGHSALARRLFDVIDEVSRQRPEAWADARADLDWLRPWLTHGSPCHHYPACGVVRVLGYLMPDRNAEVMVPDLARMRADGFCREFIAYAERYGMNDQQILNCYTGPDRERLPGRWNARPTQEVVTHPAIIHWAGGAETAPRGVLVVAR